MSHVTHRKRFGTCATLYRLYISKTSPEHGRRDDLAALQAPAGLRDQGPTARTRKSKKNGKCYANESLFDTKTLKRKLHSLITRGQKTIKLHGSIYQISAAHRST